MGGNGKYYNVESYETWKKNRANANVPPRANFLAAVHYIRNLLDGKKFTWAAVGGLAMLCLGARREMHDIHVVYNDQDFTRLKAKLEADQRTRLPTGMNTLFPSKLLVSTGPKYKDSGCSENVEVEVNLLPPGAHGAPSTDILRSNMVLLSLKSEGKDIGVKGLNLLYIVKTMLAFYKIRELSWDPRRDILFLCQHYGREIESVRGQLIQRDVQENFLGTSFFAKLTPEDQRLCYQVLLGKEPPPKMSLTPAPPQLSSSATESARPRIPSHKSSPSLNTAMQQQPAFLTPPKPGKPKSSRPRTAGAAVPSSEGPKPGPAPISASALGKPQSQPVPASGAAARDSRSRYRPVNNSAPNTPNASRNVSPEAPSEIASRPKSMAINMSAQQPANPSYKAHSVGVQNVPNAAKPRVVSMHPQAPQSTQTRKSMPNLNAGPTGKVPVFAHSQQMQAVPQAHPMPPQGYQFQGFSPALAMGPAQHGGMPPFPQQGHTGPVESRHAGPAHHAELHPTPPIPQQGFMGQIEYRPAGSAHQTQFHPTPPISQQGFMGHIEPKPMIPAQQAQFHPTPPVPQHGFAGRVESKLVGPTYNGPITAQPIIPQTSGPQHVSQPTQGPEGRPAEKPLRVVGPQGVYAAPAKQAPAMKAAQKPPQAYGSPSLGSFVFELDAGPPEPVKPIVTQPSGFIAELPAVDLSPINWSVESQPSSLAAPAALKQSEYDVSPVSPPKTTRAIPDAAPALAPAPAIGSAPPPGTAYSLPAASAAAPIPAYASPSVSAATPQSVPAPRPVSAYVPPNSALAQRPVSAYVLPVPASGNAPMSAPDRVPPMVPEVSPASIATTAPIVAYAPPHIPAAIPTPPTDSAPEPHYQPVNPVLLEALPASLMIGGPAGQRRSPNNSLSGPSTQSSDTTAKTGAPKYQRYYSPPSSLPSSTHPSPKQDPVYKAYTRPISPPTTLTAEYNKPQPAPYVSLATQYQGAPVPQSMVPAPLKPAYPNPLQANPPTPQTPGDVQGLPLPGARKPSNETFYADFGTPPAQNHSHPPQGYFAPQQQQPQQPPQFFNPFATYEPGHKRSASHESQNSTASHDSSKLAAEYQQELPDFGNGYSSKENVKEKGKGGSVSVAPGLYAGEGYGRRDSMDFS